MSIENNLASIATSLATIAKYCESKSSNPVPAAVPAAPVVTVPAPTPAPAPAPVAAPAPVVAPVAPVVVEAPAPVANGCPIVDQPSLVTYIMNSYRDMGPVKGNMIQGVLASCGIANINDAKPEQYPAIFAGVEALKVQ